MPTEDQNKAAQMHALFPSQEIASKMASMVISKKPVGAGKSSCYPYYKEVYALKLKDSIDKMIETGESLLYRYEIYCECNNGVSKETLYKMINQAIRYLVECMDNSDLKYHTWNNSIDVRRSEERGGVLIEYSRGFKIVTGIKDFKGELVSPGDCTTPKWLLELRNWMEDDTVKPFQKDHLTLTPKDVAELKIELAEDRRLMFSVDCTSVKVMKT